MCVFTTRLFHAPSPPAPVCISPHQEAESSLTHESRRGTQCDENNATDRSHESASNRNAGDTGQGPSEGLSRARTSAGWPLGRPRRQEAGRRPRALTARSASSEARPHSKRCRAAAQKHTQTADEPLGGQSASSAFVRRRRLCVLQLRASRTNGRTNDVRTTQLL